MPLCSETTAAVAEALGEARVENRASSCGVRLISGTITKAPARRGRAPAAAYGVQVDLGFSAAGGAKQQKGARILNRFRPMPAPALR
jgi:hypothetical protein